MNTTEVDVAIVGAGAAGLAAARRLTELGKSFVLLEASHRIGGRAYTEEILPGVPFDLGCHWMHSASLNPFVKIADELGFAYTKNGYPRGGYSDGTWATEQDLADFEKFYERQVAKLKEIGYTGPLVIEREIVGDAQREDILQAIALLQGLGSAG